MESKDQLELSCIRIAQEINKGEYFFDKEFSEYEEPCAGDYLDKDALDFRYIIDSGGKYLGANVLVAFGGPNIWINTLDNCVEGYWGSDAIKRHYYKDNLGLDDYLEELYQCIKK